VPLDNRSRLDSPSTDRAGRPLKWRADAP